MLSVCYIDVFVIIVKKININSKTHGPIHLTTHPKICPTHPLLYQLIYSHTYYPSHPLILSYNHSSFLPPIRLFFHPFIYQTIYTSIYQPIHQPIFPPINLPIYLPIHQPISPSINLPIYLPIYQFIHHPPIF